MILLKKNTSYVKRTEKPDCTSAVNASSINNCADAWLLLSAAMEKRKNPSTYSERSVSTFNLRQVMNVTVLVVVVDVCADALCNAVFAAYGRGQTCHRSNDFSWG